MRQAGKARVADCSESCNLSCISLLFNIFNSSSRNGQTGGPVSRPVWGLGSGASRAGSRNLSCNLARGVRDVRVRRVRATLSDFPGGKERLRLRVARVSGLMLGQESTSFPLSLPSSISLSSWQKSEKWKAANFRFDDVSELL